MYLKNVVFSNKLEKTSSVFSLSSIFLFFFFCSLVFFFLNKCVWLILLFSNSFWNSLLILFISSLFSHEKNQPRNLHFCFCSVSFLFHFFPFSIFPSFSIITFSLIIFPLILLFTPFCFSHLFLFSPFSILPLFLYLSVSLSFFFLHLMINLSLFLHHRCCISSFCFNSFFFCLSLSLLLKFVSSSPSLFCLFQKNSKFSVVIFLKTRLCLYFSNPPVIRVKSRVFFLLASSFFLVCSMFLLLRSFIVPFLDHRYFSWFYFINLLFGPLKNRFELRTYHSSFNVFFFFWKDLVSLCFCPPKKKTFKKCSILFTFSLLLLLDSFSLHVSSRYVYSPCCCSCNWQKIYGKKIVFYFSPSHIFQKKDKNSFFFGRTFLFFFSILFHSRSIFANKHLFYQIYRWVSLSLLQKLFRILKMNFSRFFVIFLTQVFLILFSSLFLFLFITFRFHLFFHFLLCLIFDFLHIPSSWTQFFWTAISPSSCKKNSSTFPLFHACVTSVCPFARGFVHLLSFFFLFVFSRFYYTFVSLFLLSSLSITSLTDKFVELLQSKKNLFV